MRIINELLGVLFCSAAICHPRGDFWMQFPIPLLTESVLVAHSLSSFSKYQKEAVSLQNNTSSSLPGASCLPGQGTTSFARILMRAGMYQTQPCSNDGTQKAKKWMIYSDGIVCLLRR